MQMVQDSNGSKVLHMKTGVSITSCHFPPPRDSHFQLSQLTSLDFTAKSHTAFSGGYYLFSHFQALFIGFPLWKVG